MLFGFCNLYTLNYHEIGLILVLRGYFFFFYEFYRYYSDTDKEHRV